jgi:hypothetical protein
VQLLIELTGWVAMVLILAAYALLTAGRLTGQSVVYQLLNVAGAACFVVYLGWKGAWPSVALNVVWFLIGAVALVRILGRKSSPRP